MNDKLATGKLGEDLALRFLLKLGWVEKARNYRYKRSEIDLIMLDEDTLVFVEVKSRRGLSKFGFPEEAVDAKKAAKVHEGAEQYLEEHQWHGSIRFDIISVQLLNSRSEIRHFKDAF